MLLLLFFVFFSLGDVATQPFAPGAVLSGTIGNPALVSTGVTAGTYTNANVTVGEDGRIVSISSGSSLIMGPAGGDLGGTYPNPTVVSARGIEFSSVNVGASPSFGWGTSVGIVATDGIAIGNSAVAGRQAVSIGSPSRADLFGTSLGSGTSSWTFSVSVGIGAQARGDSAIALGRSANCPGNNGIAIGEGATVSGIFGGIAIGRFASVGTVAGGSAGLALAVPPDTYDGTNNQLYAMLNGVRRSFMLDGSIGEALVIQTGFVQLNADSTTLAFSQPGLIDFHIFSLPVASLRRVRVEMRQNVTWTTGQFTIQMYDNSGNQIWVSSNINPAATTEFSTFFFPPNATMPLANRVFENAMSLRNLASTTVNVIAVSDATAWSGDITMVVKFFAI